MTNEEKKRKIIKLSISCGDLLVLKFLDLESDKMLDEKIDVLTKLSDGIPPAEIANYYDILELYPKDENSKHIIWD